MMHGTTNISLNVINIFKIITLNAAGAAHNTWFLCGIVSVMRLVQGLKKSVYKTVFPEDLIVTKLCETKGAYI